MLFNSAEFLLFLPLVLAVFYLLGRFGARCAVVWLFLASLFFYGWWNPSYLLLISLSIVGNYGVGYALGAIESERFRLPVLVVGIAGNLFVLGWYKYAQFLSESFRALFGTGEVFGSIILPLAISFFTFQQIAYLVDNYRKECHHSAFLDYCLFVSFFPQLIAGPIVHHRELIPQFKRASTFRISDKNFSRGLGIFLIGLSKKVILADTAAKFASPVFDGAGSGATLTFFDSWAGALGYTYQLYFDFSGYSDMAIGIALMFNISLPQNFNSPYKAASMIDFWRRWHMTLSRFLRDYVYIPKGQS